MTDIRTVFISMDRGADMALDDFALANDDGLETAIILSFFTDARARDDDPLPIGQTDRRGWWGDSVAPVVPGDIQGSRLWLLQASKQLQQSLNEAKEYAEESLAWMVEDKIAARVEVDAYIARDEVLGLAARITKPDGTIARFRFETLWNRT